MILNSEQWDLFRQMFELEMWREPINNSELYKYLLLKKKELSELIKEWEFDDNGKIDWISAIVKLRQWLSLPKFIDFEMFISIVQLFRTWNKGKESYNDLLTIVRNESIRKTIWTEWQEIGKTIYNQSEDIYQSLVELVSNAIDASNENGQIGRFGVWFFQSLALLEEWNWRLTVTTKRWWNQWYEISFKKQWTIKVGSLICEKQDIWTHIILQKRFTEKEQQKFRNFLISRFKVNTRSRIILNWERVNKLWEYKYYNWIALEDPKTEVVININENWFEVIDKWVWMDSKIISESLLYPKSTTKKKVNLEWEALSKLCEEQTKFFYKNKYKVEDKTKISLQIAWVVIEEFEEQTIWNIWEFILEFPSFTYVPESRNQIQITRGVVISIKNMMEKIHYSVEDINEKVKLIEILWKIVNHIKERPTDEVKKQYNLGDMLRNTFKWLKQDIEITGNVVLWVNEKIMNLLGKRDWVIYVSDDFMDFDMQKTPWVKKIWNNTLYRADRYFYEIEFDELAGYDYYISPVWVLVNSKYLKTDRERSILNSSINLNLWYESADRMVFYGRIRSINEQIEHVSDITVEWDNKQLVINSLGSEIISVNWWEQLSFANQIEEYDINQNFENIAKILWNFYLHIDNNNILNCLYKEIRNFININILFYSDHIKEFEDVTKYEELCIKLLVNDLFRSEYKKNNLIYDMYILFIDLYNDVDFNVFWELISFCKDFIEKTTSLSFKEKINIIEILIKLFKKEPKYVREQISRINQIGQWHIWLSWFDVFRLLKKEYYDWLTIKELYEEDEVEFFVRLQSKFWKDIGNCLLVEFIWDKTYVCLKTKYSDHIELIIIDWDWNVKVMDNILWEIVYNIYQITQIWDKIYIRYCVDGNISEYKFCIIDIDWGVSVMKKIWTEEYEHVWSIFQDLDSAYFIFRNWDGIKNLCKFNLSWEVVIIKIDNIMPNRILCKLWSNLIISNIIHDDSCIKWRYNLLLLDTETLNSKIIDKVWDQKLDIILDNFTLCWDRYYFNWKIGTNYYLLSIDTNWTIYKVLEWKYSNLVNLWWTLFWKTNTSDKFWKIFLIDKSWKLQIINSFWWKDYDCYKLDIFWDTLFWSIRLDNYRRNLFLNEFWDYKIIDHVWWYQIWMIFKGNIWNKVSSYSWGSVIGYSLWNYIFWDLYLTDISMLSLDIIDFCRFLKSWWEFLMIKNIDIYNKWWKKIRMSEIMWINRLKRHDIDNFWRTWGVGMISEFEIFVNKFRESMYNLELFQDEIASTIEWQDRNSMIWIREVSQNSIDAMNNLSNNICENDKQIKMDFFFDENTHWVSKIQDPVWMDLYELFQFLLYPWKSWKQGYWDKSIWMFWQWFLSLAIWAKQILVKTSKWDWEVVYLNIVPIYNDNNIIIDFDIEYDTKKEQFKWTIIERIDQSKWIWWNIRALIWRRNILKYVWNIDCDIILNWERINNKKILIEEEIIPWYWELKLYASSDKQEKLTSNNLYLNKLPDIFFSILPEWIIKYIRSQNLTIDLPNMIPLTKTRNSINWLNKYFEIMKPYLYRIFVRYILKEYIQWKIMIPMLPEDYYGFELYDQRYYTKIIDIANRFNWEWILDDKDIEFLKDKANMAEFLTIVEFTSNWKKISLLLLKKEFEEGKKQLTWLAQQNYIHSKWMANSINKLMEFADRPRLSIQEVSQELDIWEENIEKFISFMDNEFKLLVNKLFWCDVINWFYKREWWENRLADYWYFNGSIYMNWNVSNRAFLQTWINKFNEFVVYEDIVWDMTHELTHIKEWKNEWGSHQKDLEHSSSFEKIQRDILRDFLRIKY